MYKIKLSRYWRKVVVAGGLLGLLFLVLMTPTIKPVKTYEVRPENQGVVLRRDEPVISVIRLPAEEIDYVSVWVVDQPGENRLQRADYEGVVLEVRSVEGEVKVRAKKPRLMKRDDKPALVFDLAGAKLNPDELYSMAVTQTGDGEVKLQVPLDVYNKQGQSVQAAFQLGRRKNWITFLLDKVYSEDLVGHDISFYLHRGNQIVRGENPYACTLQANECVGYPAHLPGMYWFAAGWAWLGFDELDEWATVWRPMMLASWLGVGIVLFSYIFRKGKPGLAVAATGLWLFNRWSLDVLRVAHTDFTGVLFLVLAVVTAGSWPMVAAVLLGFSLAVKQVAALVVPLFLIWVWRRHQFNWQKMLLVTGVVAVVPLVVTLPFVIDNPLATITGLMNAVERPAQSVRGFAPSFDEWLDVTSMAKLGPMLALVAIVYAAAWRKEISLAGGTLVVMGVMMAFTSVLYNQYFVWFVPFIPLILVDMRRRSTRGGSD